MRTDGQTDRETDMMKLIVAFRKSVNAPIKAKQDSVNFQSARARRSPLQKNMYFEVPSLVTL
jgi:hypothetical protein